MSITRLNLFAALIIVALTFAHATVSLARSTKPATTTPSSAAPTPTVVIQLSGTVDDFNRDALKKRFADARELGATTVILDVDTYGGAVSSALDISRFIKQQKDLRTIAFVGEKAISAGIMIAMSADELVMAPGAMIGDSAPIAVHPRGGLQPLPAAERAKLESPILADFYDSALRNGYDPLLAEAMVSVGKSVYWVQGPTGERKFVDAMAYEKLKTENWTDVPGVPVPVDSTETLLTVGTDLAAKLGLAKSVHNSIDDLAASRNLKVMATLEPLLSERVVLLLGSDIFRGLLLTGFSLALYAALHTPGHGAPEAIALTCLGALVGVPILTGYAQWWEIVAILLGLALVATEIFVIPGFGVSGISGILLVVCGLLLTFVPLEPGRGPVSLPSMPATWAAVQSGLTVIVVALVASIGLSFWMRKYLPQMPIFRRLILTEVAGGAGVMGTNPTLGNDEAATWPPVGATGRASTDLLPGGSAKFMDDAVGAERSANVVSDSGFIAAGAMVVVREVGGNRVVVRPA